MSLRVPLGRGNLQSYGLDCGASSLGLLAEHPGDRVGPRCFLAMTYKKERKK